jgi:hypothetical protein
MAARSATAKYATNLNRAKADGYGILAATRSPVARERT